ncbi:hypothetical protein [uncultured Nitratireductor sp.]|uniref:hypothetical protein n=1 Tax=uncultured Nitratireductor sp. TaxID=520953 RepID=UPI002634347B|nr:hypothetical protein [uncultured Nitratireductor sp.]
MKKFRIAALAGVSLLAMTVHAYAIESIVIGLGYALFASPLGAVFSFSALVGFSQLAVAGALIGGSLLAGQQRGTQNIDPGQFKNQFENSEMSEVNAGGRVRLGGLKAFGNTKRDKIYRWIWHCRGPAVGLEEYLLGGREIVIDPDGAVSSPPFARPGTSWVFVKTKPGSDDEVAYPDLLSAFPSLWTVKHRGRGVFQSLIRYESPGFGSNDNAAKHQKMYGGGYPDLEVTARVGVVYDPRDGTQSVDNPATWKWSMNGVLWAVHIARQNPQFTSADFDWSKIAAEADKADAPVATLTGTEPRSTFSGVWLSETAKGDTMVEVLRSIGGEIKTTRENRHYVALIDDARQPEVEFTTVDLLKLGIKYGPDGLRRKNICRVWYYSPERNFEMTEVDVSGQPWASVPEEVDRYGPKYLDVRLPFCPSASQAQRIARRLFLMERARSGQMDLLYSGMACWGVSAVSFPMPDMDETVIAQIESPREDQDTGRVNAPFKIIPDELLNAPWTPATMEAPAPKPAPPMQYESDLDTPDVLATSVVQYPGGAYETRVKFSGVSGGATAEANYRTYTDGLPDLWLPMIEYSEHGHYGYVAANTVGKEADFRARWFNGEDEASYFSDVVNVPDMQIDNSAPPEPYLDVQVTDNGVGDYTFDAVAYSTAMNMVRFVFTGLASNYNGDARPGQTFTANETISNGPSAQTVTITATAYSSNGTPSPVATFTYVIPQDPNVPD